MSMTHLEDGEFVNALVLNRPMKEALDQSGYAEDGSDFAGFAKAVHVHSAEDITTGTLATARGGTGQATTATGDLLYASGVATWARRAIGAASMVLVTLAGVPDWSKISNAHVDDAAAIGYSKLNLVGSLVNADVANGAAIAYAKLALGNSIVNADIAAGAAIVDTKLAQLTTAGKVANSATTATAVATPSTIVLRDGSGDFAANTVTAALVGNASTTTALLNARTLWGQSFNGTANVAGALTGVTDVTASGTVNAANFNGVIGATTPAAATFTTVQTTGNLTVDGDLLVSGNVVTINTANIAVEDPLIKLATANVTDAVDMGFFSLYQPAATPLYTGFFRDATDGKYKLFSGLQVEPTTTVNLGGAGYAVATMVAHLEGNVTGALVGNASTATTLANPRTLWGVSFDGSANVTAAPAFAAGFSGTTMVLSSTATAASYAASSASGAFIGATLTTSDTTGSARYRAAATGSNTLDLAVFSASHASRANQAWMGGDGNTVTTVIQAGGTEAARFTTALATLPDSLALSGAITGATSVATADLTVTNSGSSGLANIALFKNSAGTATGVRLATNQTTGYAHVAAYANGAAGFGLKLQYQDSGGTITDGITLAQTGAVTFAAGISATTYSGNGAMLNGDGTTAANRIFTVNVKGGQFGGFLFQEAGTNIWDFSHNTAAGTFTFRDSQNAVDVLTLTVGAGISATKGLFSNNDNPLTLNNSLSAASFRTVTVYQRGGVTKAGLGFDASDVLTVLDSALTGVGPLATGELVATKARLSAAPSSGSGLSLGYGASASATAGSNGAVPAQVAGYLPAYLDGTAIRIPYFNV